jgi:hypothetical protein
VASGVVTGAVDAGTKIVGTGKKTNSKPVALKAEVSASKAKTPAGKSSSSANKKTRNSK